MTAQVRGARSVAGIVAVKASTVTTPFKVGEPVSDTNPLPVTLDASNFKVGEPVSDTNPLPLTDIGPPPKVGETMSSARRVLMATSALTTPFRVGEPVSATNPLPVKGLKKAPVTTWNPAAKSAKITLSNANLTAQGVADNTARQPVLATTSITSGKRYFEVVITPMGAYNQPSLGLTNYKPADSTQPANTTNTIVRMTNGIVKYGGSDLAIESGHSANTPVVLGCAIDADADKVWFSKNGVFDGNPAAGTGGYSVPGIQTYFPMFTAFDNDIGTLRRTESEFTGTVPAGFKGWDD